MTTVKEEVERAHTVEEQRALDEQLELGEKNYATDAKVASYAQKVVSGCLAEVEILHTSRRSKWAKMEKAYGLESLSENAWDYGVHLGTPFRAVEEFATKMNATVFSGRQLIDGTPEDREHGSGAKAAVALVNEVMKNDLKLFDQGPEMFRDAGLKGAIISKIVPSKKVIRTYERTVEGRTDADGAINYKFGERKAVEIADTRFEHQTVLAEDFRIPSTASSIDDAAWCGHYAYMSGQEIQDMVDRGVFAEAAWNELKERGEKYAHAEAKTKQKTQGHRKHERQDEPDKGPHLDQYAIFEWWGLMRLKENGPVVPCVVTLAIASTSQGFETSLSTALRVTENPYYHQRKPYVAFRPLARRGEFWTRGPAEVVAANSYYEDEMAMYALMAAALESSPPLEVGEDAEVEDDELDGFLPGHRFRVSQTGLVGFVAPPARSGIGFQTAEYLSHIGKENAGLGKPANAPRAAAAGIMTDAQQLDLRQAAWVFAFESQYLKPAAELIHAYMRQFMTRERKLNVLGIDGLNAEDIRTVKPTDLAMEVRFEPIVGRQLQQQAVQIQGFVNMMDRMMMMNQMQAQAGKPELFDLQYITWTVLHDGFQIRDKKVLTDSVDPMDMPSPQEEHLMWQRGEKVEVLKGENLAAHLQAHLSFVQSPAFAAMDPENQQIAIDHVHETIDAAARETQAAMPGITEMLNEMLGREALHSRPGFGDQAGGTGVSSPSQNPGSPSIRRPTPGAAGPNASSM